VVKSVLDMVAALTSREQDHTKRHSLKANNIETMVRFSDMFGPTEGAIVFHLMSLHSTEDLRWGWLQGLFMFESMWGFLGRLCTRTSDPEENIMAMHRRLLFTNVRNPFRPHGSALDCLQQVNKRRKIAGFTALIQTVQNPAGTVVAASSQSRVAGHMDVASIKGRTDVEEVLSRKDRQRIGSLHQMTKAQSLAVVSTVARRFASVNIGGRERSGTDHSSNNTAGFALLDAAAAAKCRGSQAWFGVIKHFVEVELVGKSNNPHFFARTSFYNKAKFAKRSRLPVVRLNEHQIQDTLIPVSRIGAMVAFVNVKGGSQNRRAVLYCSPDFTPLK
jgi:hypothetical protein